MGLVVTTALCKLSALTKRVRIIQGGTSAGKTYGILPLLIDYATKNPKKEISVVSETMPHIRKGAMRDFLKIMSDTGRYIPEHWNKSNSIYTFANGSFIEFFSADQQAKVRGPRRDVLYINECNNLDFETYNQLAIRTREVVWLDYNPTSEFWVNTELKDEDNERIILTYKDNESLNDTIVKEIEKAREKAFYNANTGDLFAEQNIRNAYWANWWKVYGMGEVGSVQGCIYSDWDIVQSIPTGARLLGYGLDFGYQDPTAILALYMYDNELYIDEVCYRSGMTNQDIARELKDKGIARNARIFADCAEPKSIAEVNGYGYNLQECKKGADSIKFGIDLLQQYKMHVTQESTNMIKEMRNWVWETDKQGKRTGRPIDAYCHLQDALRYIATMTISRAHKGGITGAITL